MPSRDSWLWSLSILGATLTYLAAASHPMTWTYSELIQFLAFIVATVSGKLATSPLQGKPPTQ